MSETNVPEVRVFLAGKADSSGVIVPQAADIEDEFAGLYGTPDRTGGNYILQPPYDLYTLAKLCQQNNALGACIDAMEVNIDGTGYVIEADVDATTGHEVNQLEQQIDDLDQQDAQLDGDSAQTQDGEPPQAPDVTDPQAVAQHELDSQQASRVRSTRDSITVKQRQLADRRKDIDRKLQQARDTLAQKQKAARIKSFFDEPWPQTSFLTIRRELRRDLETTGNAYIEVLRNAAGELALLRRVDSKTVRMLRLGPPVAVEKTFTRNGEPVTFTVAMRERKFIQIIAGKMIYFREFGASRQVDRDTGRWEDDDYQVNVNRRGSELIHLTLNPDVLTPYGVPRWIPQLPSVLGSRKAEEYNLTYFDAGGVPPALIVIQGGSMAAEARRSLEDNFSTAPTKKHRVVVLEAYATGGSLDATNNVRVTVERFQQQADALFQAYDENCANRVRGSFRMPELFIGDGQKTNYATAQVSYMIAEAQVFKPDRDEFDEIVNTRIMPEIGGGGFVFRSKPIAVKDVQRQLMALQLAAGTKVTTNESLVDEINEIAGLTLEPAPNGQATAELGQVPQMGNGGGSGGGGSGVSLGQMGKAMKSEGVYALAAEASLALRKRDLPQIERMMRQADTLGYSERLEFDRAMALHAFVDPSVDPEGLGQLAGCAAALIAANR